MREKRSKSRYTGERERRATVKRSRGRSCYDINREDGEERNRLATTKTKEKRWQ